jgi:hypothetical protein
MQGVSHHDPDIFDRVVFIDVNVALRLNGQIEEAVPRQQLQHMIEKPDPGVDLSLSSAVNRPFDANVGLFRRSM